MYRRPAIGIAVFVCIALLIGIWPSSAQQSVQRVTPKWEYKQVDGPSAADLTKLGDDNWEIVTVVGGQPFVKTSGVGPPAPVVGGQPITITTYTIDYSKLIYVFKRQK
jgi:hypothetical protein